MPIISKSDNKFVATIEFDLSDSIIKTLRNVSLFDACVLLRFFNKDIPLKLCKELWDSVNNS